ncbi:MAG: hypothetical protein ACTTKL_00070 [Treponema sp.]
MTASTSVTALKPKETNPVYEKAADYGSLFYFEGLKLHDGKRRFSSGDICQPASEKIPAVEEAGTEKRRIVLPDL